MAVRTKEEIMAMINSMIPEGSEDLSALEDVKDTFEAFEAQTKPDGYKEKYEALYEKYRTRFMEGPAAPKAEDPTPEEHDPEPVGKIKFEELFKEEYR